MHSQTSDLFVIQADIAFSPDCLLRASRNIVAPTSCPLCQLEPTEVSVISTVRETSVHKGTEYKTESIQLKLNML